MSSIEDLVHYCQDPDPIGALMCTGEWGSGKTHLIENELVEALGPDYAIVRVSLFGVNNMNAFEQKVRENWVATCYPFVNKIHERREMAKKNSGFFKMLLSVGKKLNPFLGGTADILNSMNIVDAIHIEPEFEDIKSRRKRRAIMVFDDLERCSMNLPDLLGAINEICENHHFNTIIVANLK